MIIIEKGKYNIIVWMKRKKGYKNFEEPYTEVYEIQWMVAMLGYHIELFQTCLIMLWEDVKLKTS